MIRKRYTIAQKQKIIAKIEEKENIGETFVGACQNIGISPSTAHLWKKQKQKFETTLKTKKSLGAGFQSILKPYEEQLIQWLFDQRHVGLPVSIA